MEEEKKKERGGENESFGRKSQREISSDESVIEGSVGESPCGSSEEIVIEGNFCRKEPL